MSVTQAPAPAQDPAQVLGGGREALEIGERRALELATGVCAAAGAARARSAAVAAAASAAAALGVWDMRGLPCGIGGRSRGRPSRREPRAGRTVASSGSGPPATAG